MSNLLDKVDVLVIGGGINGCLALRLLSRYKYDVALVERHADVAGEQTKANNGNVSIGGHYFLCEVARRVDDTGQHKAIFTRERSGMTTGWMLFRYLRDLGVKYLRIGYMLVALSSKELEMLKIVRHRVRCDSGPYEFTTNVNRIKEIEPNISDKVVGALLFPHASAQPWDFPIALYENARQNGARAHFSAEVINITWQKDKENFLVETERGDIEAGYIINAAGYGAAKLAKMIGNELKGYVKPTGALEEYIILDDTCKGIINHVVRRLSYYGREGVLGLQVTPMPDGEFSVGHSYQPTEDIDNVGVTREGMEFCISEAKTLIPALPISETAIAAYAGVMPSFSEQGIYHPELLLGPSEKNQRFINFTTGGFGTAAGKSIDIAVTLDKAGLYLGRGAEKDNFNPIRPPLKRRFSEASNDERDRLIAKDPRYGHVICRCKYVTEAEVVEAIRRGATTYGGVSWRTGLGTGRCQGAFDKPRVLAILARELGIPQTELTLKGGTSIETMFTAKELLKEGVKIKRPRYVEPRFDSEELKKSYGDLLEELEEEEMKDYWKLTNGVENLEFYGGWEK